MNFYTCVTCHNLNGAFRLHCQICGTIPDQYSITGKAEMIERNADASLAHEFISIVPAIGCDRQENHYSQRAYLRTVELDYYAGA